MFIGWSLALAVDVADVRAALETYNAGAVHRLPALTDAQVAELVAGGCVRLMAPNADPDGPSSAVGMVLSDVPRAALWVAAQDPHAVVDPDLTEFVVEQIGPDEAIWYGYWDLPKPVHDRQWVIRSWNNHALASRTGGAAWEHVWRRVDDGLSLLLIADSTVARITQTALLGLDLRNRGIGLVERLLRIMNRIGCFVITGARHFELALDRALHSELGLDGEFSLAALGLGLVQRLRVLLAAQPPQPALTLVTP